MRHPFGTALLRVLRSGEAYALLPDGTWLAGGCWPLAKALRTLLGPGAQLRAVTSLAIGPNGPFRMPQHVVVQVGDVWLDGDGVSTARELLLRMRVLERLWEPRLERFSVGAVRRAELWEGRGCSRGLVRLFHQRLPSDLAVAFAVEHRRRPHTARAVRSRAVWPACWTVHPATSIAEHAT